MEYYRDVFPGQIFAALQHVHVPLPVVRPAVPEHRTRLPVREGTAPRSGGRRRRRSFGGRLISGEADRGPVPAQGDDQRLVDRGEDEADAGHARDQTLVSTITIGD